MSLVTDELLEHIQRLLGLEHVSYRNLGHGAHNDNYLLETSQGKLVLRIYANTQFENASKEYKVLLQLNGFLGPKAHFLDISRSLIEYDYMVLEYIEGTVIEEFSDESLVDVASKLKKLHTVKIGTPRSGSSPVSEWTSNNIKENSKRLGLELHEEVMVLWEQLMKLHKNIEPYLTSFSPNTLIHDDPILGNFIKTENGVRLIDWELAHPNYFFMELGGFIEENGLTEHQEKIFLKAYGFGANLTEEKILAFSKAYRVAAIIGWYIERIAQLRDGEKVFIGADQAEYEKNLEKEIQHLNKLLQ